MSNSYLMQTGDLHHNTRRGGRTQQYLHRRGAAERSGRDEGKTSLSESRPTVRRLNLVPVNSNLRSATECDRTWVSKALCRSTDPDELFVRGAAQRKAAVICRHCPVMQQCAADALDNQVEYGVWGGLTERQRRALLKEHPEVVSWAEFLESAITARSDSAG